VRILEAAVLDWKVCAQQPGFLTKTTTLYPATLRMDLMSGHDWTEAAMTAYAEGKAFWKSAQCDRESHGALWLVDKQASDAMPVSKESADDDQEIDISAR
jgi:hypothetical protein